MEIELNTIYNENCIDTMKRMTDGFIDLTVTSPPYDNLRDYKGYVFDFESIAKELYRVTKDGGVVVWVVGDATINGSETGTSFKQALYFKEIGFKLHDTMIYAKQPSFPECNRYYQEFEYMFVFVKGKFKIFNPLKQLKTEKSLERHFKKNENIHNERQKNTSLKPRSNNAIKRIEKANKNKYRIKSNIWYIPKGFDSINKKTELIREHPATFPEKLASDHIYSWSNENDIVYDPFMGSGTTGKMAHLLKRRWIGSEISKEYCNIANKRLKPYLQQGVMF